LAFVEDTAGYECVGATRNRTPIARAERNKPQIFADKRRSERDKKKAVMLLLVF
jgi:hypothetical protein